MAPASDSNNEGVANEGVNENGSSQSSNNSAYVSKGSPPPYDHALYANYGKTVLQPGSAQPGAELQIASFTNPTPATTSASYVGVGTTSFTNTFLRGILTSIDSKDPVVANAWLDTLLDAIDLLPPDVIKREIVAIAVSKGQLTNNVASRKSACRLLGKIATKLDAQALRQDVLPTTLALCQDIDWEVRHAMCRHLALISRGVGQEATKAMIMPQVVELSNDEMSEVRLAAIETVVNLLSILDDEICTNTIVPLVIKSCDQAKQLEDETLPRLAHHLGRLCHGLMPNINGDQKSWFTSFYKHLSGIGLDANKKGGVNGDGGGGQMPDLVPPIADKSEVYSECRKECAYNFPAMVIFVGPNTFLESLYSTFAGLASDPAAKVRSKLASSLHELAKLVGTNFNTTKVQIVRLFHDDAVEVLGAMITNMVPVIDALARFGVLQFGQGGQFSADLSAALLHCEATVDRTRNWRLQADCLEKFSCLANCISPVTIQTRFIPLLFDRMKNTRTLPCKIAAARTLLVILRFTVKSDDRTHIHFRIREELARANSCHIRILHLRLCEMAIALFSKEYFKHHFFGDLIGLSSDIVANVRLKLCTMMPRLKSLLSLPSDKVLLQRLEATVKDLLLRETDADVLFALQTSIQDLDGTETGVDGVPSMNLEEDRDNERKLREERLIVSMEDQLYKIHSVQSSPNKSSNKNSAVPIPTFAGGSSPRNRLYHNDLDTRQTTIPTSLPQPPIRHQPLPPDLSSLAHQTPEPSRTYSPELSVLKNDSFPFDFNNRTRPGGDPNNPPSLQQTIPSTTNQQLPSQSWEAFLAQDNANKVATVKQPYSSSLENLDPSAKEFLVDAGVILDNSSQVLTSASSMPNLASTNTGGSNSGNITMVSSANSASQPIANLEGEFAKYLISNAEMEQYEAEYKRCASIIANGSIEQLASHQTITSPTSTYAIPNGTTPTNLTTIPSTPPMGIPRQSRSPSKPSSPTKQSPPPPPLPPTYQSVGAEITDGVANFAQSTISNISKLTTGSSTDIQTSFDRLAEKWEAKRKSLIAVASGSFDFEDQVNPEEITTSTELATKQQRATIMEQKLQAIKQQGIPKKRASLLKTPSKTSLHGSTSQKRLSLTDQVEAVGQRAVHKFIIEPNQRRKSMEMMINFSDSEQERSSESNSSGDEMHMKSLPNYPVSSAHYSQSSPSATDDSMITYVNSSLGYSNAAGGSPTHLVVKPVGGGISNPGSPGGPPVSIANRGMIRLPMPSNHHGPPRSLPQPPRSLPMPPTYRQTTVSSNSLIRAPSTSLLSNRRSVYSVNKPNQMKSQPSRQLPQPKRNVVVSTNQQPATIPVPTSASEVSRMYYQPVAVLPQPPSPKKSSIPGSSTKHTSNTNKPISPYIVSVNSPPNSPPNDHSPTATISASSGSNVSTGSSSSQSSTEAERNPSQSNRSSVQGPKYTRVPPPRYRPHQPPLAQRRPLSGGSSYQHHHDQPPPPAQQRMNNSGPVYHHQQQYQQQNNLRRYGTKSVSAESVLERPAYGAGTSSSMKTSSGGSSSRSSSPPSSNSELTPEDSPGRLGGPPHGPMRRSSGLRMWQGHQHQPRGATGRPINQQGNRNPSRSPSPGSSNTKKPPTSQLMQQPVKSRTNPDQGQMYSRGSSLPGAYHGAYQRGSSAHSSPHHQQKTTRRPSSLHNSPGSSRPSSPQISMHQKRKSSHYPGSTVGPPPSYGQRQQQQTMNRGDQVHQQQQQQQQRGMTGLHYSNNAKRQLQQPQQQQKQYSSRYSQDNGKVGLPAPGFSSRLPMGASQRSN